MPNFVLKYFNLPGRGHAVRLAFEVAGIPYEDELIEFANWPALKPSCNYCQLPVLLVDGKQLAQTNTILRFVGRQPNANLYPANLWEAAVVDELLEAVESIADMLFRKPPTPDDQASYRARLASETIPAVLANVEKRLLEVGTTPGCAVGLEMTVLDIKIYQANALFEAGFLDGIPKDLIGDKYATMAAIIRRVAEHPAVVAFEAKGKK